MTFIHVLRWLGALGLALPALAEPAAAPYPGWDHSGSLWLITTPEGADLPATASERDFPLLVRLHRDFFPFQQAQPNGEDLRFSDSANGPLSYEIEEWDARQGTASVWVRIPRITGNTRQEITVHWGKPDAASESSGPAVFGGSNGYLSVWHLTGPPRDAVGTLDSKDLGTTSTLGRIGSARHFEGGQGVFCGDRIVVYPSGASPHTSEAWFRTRRPNVTLLGWGNEGGGRGSKIRMQLRSPPHVHVDSDFSDVAGRGRVPMSEWTHVVHTYSGEEGRIYLNGRLDGAATRRLDIRNPLRMWLGGWYDHYDFVGDLDEVRVSKVARSPDWVRLEYENQKPLPTLTGPVVQPGTAFSVFPATLAVPEGKSATLSAEAGGALKVSWVLVREGAEEVVAVDRFRFVFEAGRVTGDTTATLRFKALCPGGLKTQDIPVVVRETIPEPDFTLEAPGEWDGRSPIEVVPRVANLAEMQAAGAGALEFTWNVSDLAVVQRVVPGKLILERAQNSGKLTLTATVRNGGEPRTQTATMRVTEPARDAWVARPPARDEKPEDNQLYARDDRNEGTLFYRGTLSQPADSVFLEVRADGEAYRKDTCPVAVDGSYAFAVKLKPGLIRYQVAFGARTGDHESVLHTVTNVVCGDAYLINGQSNAVATDWGEEEPTFRSDWIRTFGSMSGEADGFRLWGNAAHRGAEGERLQIGYWGMELARRLVENHAIPICILNGAVGGTRIDQHQRSRDEPLDRTTIYGRLLWRAQQARLTHGLRGVLWHQGENDQGADGPTGGFGWETYRQYFIELAAAWKQDYPNLQHYYVFQIWPKSCAMGVDGSDNRLREVQRNLPTAFSRMSLMSTLGVEPPGGCHYPAAGYAEIARLICPLVERDHYGTVFTHSITPPNLRRAYYTNDKRDEIALEFDQAVKWEDSLVTQFYVDGQAGKVVSGAALGNTVSLRLLPALGGRVITYLDGKSWKQDTLLRGENGIAALTFCEVPLESHRSSR